MKLDGTHPEGNNEDAFVEAVKRVFVCPIRIVGIPECLERYAGAEKSDNCSEELE